MTTGTATLSKFLNCIGRVVQLIAQVGMWSGPKTSAGRDALASLLVELDDLEKQVHAIRDNIERMLGRGK